MTPCRLVELGGLVFSYEIRLKRQCSHTCYHNSVENPRDCSRTTIVSHRPAPYHVDLLYSFSYGSHQPVG